MTQLLKPFMKWPGGKRWLVEKHAHLLPEKIENRYIEPFVGGGAIFFALQPSKAILADLCDDLITVYRGIRNQSARVSELLEIHSNNHCLDYFYQIRSEEPVLIAERAARMIYLNRTCFNGIYRVNRYGKFNVPIGSRDNIVRESDFLNLSKTLKKSTLMVSDFEDVLDKADCGDFVFCDPPYTVRHNSNGFIKYNEVLFSWEDQKRLHACLMRAKIRGVQLLMTNANHQSIRDLYTKGFEQKVVSRFSSIAASSAKRDRFEELIIQC